VMVNQHHCESWKRMRSPDLQTSAYSSIQIACCIILYELSIITDCIYSFFYVQEFLYNLNATTSKQTRKNNYSSIFVKPKNFFKIKNKLFYKCLDSKDSFKKKIYSLSGKI
jgi:hypothetical protein